MNQAITNQNQIFDILPKSKQARAITKNDALQLLSLSENILEASILCSTVNAFFPEAGEPINAITHKKKNGFTTALWRQSSEINTNDCRKMMEMAGFSPIKYE